jgi:hypothetical protein
LMPCSPSTSKVFTSIVPSEPSTTGVFSKHQSVGRLQKVEMETINKAVADAFTRVVVYTS